MNEIVKYNNYINNLNFRKFTSVNINILMTLCNKMENKNIECNSIYAKKCSKALNRFKFTFDKEIIPKQRNKKQKTLAKFKKYKNKFNNFY